MEPLSRRTFIAGSAAAGIAGSTMLAAAPARAQSAASGQVIAEIANGRLAGIQQDGSVAFKGIPYAADTGGRNRFMAPQPVENWRGVRDATQFGDRCVQYEESMSNYDVFVWYKQDAPFSENCCVLNVYTPDLNTSARRPVMFWMHGGGFQGGGGGGLAFDGSNLAKNEDVVVVSINHRINTFGFANLGFLDQRFADAANVGALDIVAALEWVRDNIAAFGGDPGNVTVFGESGGGSKVMLLMGMPAAKGLFHRGINMSGVSAMRLPQATDTEPYVLKLLEELGIARTDVRRIQEVPADALLAAWTRASSATDMTGAGPVIDGNWVPASPISPEGIAVNPEVPLLLGNCDTEITLFLRRDMRNFNLDHSQVKQRVMTTFGLDDARAEGLMDAYRDAVPGRTPTDVLIAIGSDALFRGLMLQGAEAIIAARSTPLYVYNFVFKAVADGGVWRTPHAMDIPFAFQNTHLTHLLCGPGPWPAEAASRFGGTFAAFARTGDPNNELIPQWAPYNTTDRPTMLFDTQCRVENDYRGEDRRANLEYNLLLEGNRGSLFDYHPSTSGLDDLSRE